MNVVELYRCPRCKGPLTSKPDSYECAACNLEYPVLDGIASLVATDARPLPDDQRPSRAR